MYSIRQFQEKDRSRLREICKETAWDSYKENENTLETVPIMFLDYFLDYESELVFVAVNENDEAVGYIVCASEYKKFVKVMKKVYIPKLKTLDKSQISFIKIYLFALFLIKKNATHFHIDITDEYQHQGIGRKLIDKLIEEIKRRGMNSLSVCAISRNSVGYPFYIKYGFKEIQKYGKERVSLNIKY